MSPEKASIGEIWDYLVAHKIEITSLPPGDNYGTKVGQAYESYYLEHQATIDRWVAIQRQQQRQYVRGRR